jgi:transcriptional regulator with XRE-family HTH domain
VTPPSDADNRCVIVPDTVRSSPTSERLPMKLSEIKTNDELLAEQLQANPEFRAEWERTALARAVAVAVVRWRAERELSQRDVAQLLDMDQPQVARLERGDVNPSIETLMRVSSGLGIEFTIDVRPAHSEARLVTKEAQTDNAVGTLETEHAELLVAAAG